MAETPIAATYASAAQFTVAGDLSADFAIGVRVRADCGADGIRYGTVSGVAYTSLTTVTVALDSGSLTANLTGVLHGNDTPDSLAHHGHTGPADGGAISYTALTDKPTIPTTYGDVGAAPASKGVTNGDSHDHSDGDGGQIAHASLSDIGTNTHAQIDTFLSSKAAALGLASLDASSHVVQNPANATATATASKIPIADGSGKLDTWISAASTSVAGKVALSTTTPAALGTAAAGSGTTAAKADHVHVMPTASQVGALPTAGGTMTGPVSLAAWLEAHTDLGTVSGGTLTINISLSASFSMTTGAAITSVVFTGTVPVGWRGGIEIEVTNGGTYAWTWGTMRWPGGTAPTLTASGMDMLRFKVPPTGTPIGFIVAKDVR